ncbi:MAG: OmpA family protein [Bdellovibrionota bacterium]
MKTLTTLILLSFLVLTLTFSGCASRQPYELQHVATELSNTKNDSFIVQNAPIQLRNAELAYERALKEWNENKDKHETIALARLADEEIDKALLFAGKNATAEVAEDAALAKHALIHKQDQLRSAEDAAIYYKEKSEKVTEENKLLLTELSVLDAIATKRGIEMSMNADLLFDVGEATLKAGAANELAPVVAYLKTNPNGSLIIEGHTDSSGDSAYNLNLSEQRAEAVERFLINKGVSATQITAKGLGESYPLASNNSEAGRLQNRRVDLVIPVS